MNRNTSFKIAISAIWVTLLILLIDRDVLIKEVNPLQTQILLQAEQEEYQGIYFRNSKIGYVINRYTPQENNTLKLEQKAHMNLNVGEMIHQVTLNLQATLGAANQLKTFSFDFASPYYAMQAQGYTEENTIHFTLTTGNNTVQNSIIADGPPMVPTARRGYLLHPVPEIGAKQKIPLFDPVTLTSKNSTVEYRGKERVHIHGRVHYLHRFVENFGGARVSLWLNDEGDVVKEESPAGFTFLKEPKFRAINLAETGEELLSTVAVQVIGKMPDFKKSSKIRYRLGLPEGESFEITSARQQYSDGIVTIYLEDIADEEEASLLPECEGWEQHLDASTYIQSDAEKITKQAMKLAGNETSTINIIQTISNWVYTSLEKRPVLGIPDALTTLDNLRGDCNEHAALFAALARNRGVPTKVATGVVYHKQAFYYHAWNEVCIGDQWISIDTTTNQFPADLSHIKFIEGDLDKQFKIGALLGNLTIEPLQEDDTSILQGQIE